MNVSGLKIDVGNMTAPTSSTWSIPNIPVSSIRASPTNTQLHVSEGPGSTPEISTKANPQSKFPHDFLLNTGRNPVMSQEPFGQNKQPTLNIQSGYQVDVGNEKRVDVGKQKRPLENVTQSGLSEGNLGVWHLKARQSDLRSQSKIMSDEIYASLPLVHKKEITGCHHPYAAKTRIAHSSSSRERIVDDEDENMSPNHSETNDEQKRENLMAHEEGTQSNSVFTDLQIPLAHSMPEQSEIQQQRNQAYKAHNVAKRASQKE
ncbi:hypothetical protein O181_041359 [Austropuccinia psidii MF-1]|uniref:Uncharacterized protein n=1 Tax=Austropuccinia psidii MF-1 TaxID=1389203 RepID=A0A9Q3DE91_9BASI|nr:hypothetical protein [Austropuccinia psidii MF-1]